MSSWNRRDFCRLICSSPAALAAAAPARLPNIVYVLADDLGWGDLDCYNSDSAVPTPQTSRFAQQGIRFTDMHSPSSVCTPTRYGILTGRYCWRSRLKEGVLQGYSPSLIEPGRLTVPAMLRQRGYYTAGVGKWHLGLGDREKTVTHSLSARGLWTRVSTIISASLHRSTSNHTSTSKTIARLSSQLLTRPGPHSLLEASFGGPAPSHRISNFRRSCQT
jgi:hypothetical protein